MTKFYSNHRKTKNSSNSASQKNQTHLLKPTRHCKICHYQEAFFFAIKQGLLMSQFFEDNSNGENGNKGRGPKGLVLPGGSGSWCTRHCFGVKKLYLTRTFHLGL